MAARERVVEIANYDEAWPEAFEKERELLVVTIGAYLTGSIEHV